MKQIVIFGYHYNSFISMQRLLMQPVINTLTIITASWRSSVIVAVCLSLVRFVVQSFSE